jgi:hypothetical protein
LELYMKRPVPVESASVFIDEKSKDLGDWRGKTLAKVREIIHEADPEIVEEWNWMGTPIWSQLNAEYAKQFGIEMPNWPPQAAQEA